MRIEHGNEAVVAVELVEERDWELEPFREVRRALRSLREEVKLLEADNARLTGRGKELDQFIDDLGPGIASFCLACGARAGTAQTCHTIGCPLGLGPQEASPSRAMVLGGTIFAPKAKP